jgi:hypothetical protein
MAASSPRPWAVAAAGPLGLALWPLAWLAGSGLQLQQAALLPAAQVVLLAALAVLLSCGLSSAGRRLRPAGGRAGAGLQLAAAALALAALSAGLADIRARARLADRLDPALEGTELLVEGRVVGLVQVQADGLRFAFEPVMGWRATDGAEPVALPSRLWLVWPAG